MARTTVAKRGSQVRDTCSLLNSYDFKEEEKAEGVQLDRVYSLVMITSWSSCLVDAQAFEARDDNSQPLR